MHADKETKKRMYLFLATRHGDVLGDFKGQSFTRGRLRYQKIMYLASLSRSAALRSKREEPIDGRGPRTSPFGDFVKALVAIWTAATGQPFHAPKKPRQSRGVDRPRLFVERVYEVTKKIADIDGRDLPKIAAVQKKAAADKARKRFEKELTDGSLIDSKVEALMDETAGQHDRDALTNAIVNAKTDLRKEPWSKKSSDSDVSTYRGR
jgi:hypothetical protein